MRAFAFAAALLAASPGIAPALTVTTFTNDLTFNALCNQGTGDLDCESGVGELRGGNFATSGSFETALRTPTPSGLFTNSAQGQFAWTSGQPTPVTFSHDGNGVISLSIGQAAAITMDYAQEIASDAQVIPLSEVTSLFIRSRSNLFGDPQLGDETATLTSLAFTDDLAGTTTPLPDNIPQAAGFQGAAYVALSGFDFTRAWTLTGDVTMSFPNGPRAQVDDSALAHQFKLTNAEFGEVPLPSSVMLLLAGLGGLAILRRRRART